MHLRLSPCFCCVCAIDICWNSSPPCRLLSLIVLWAVWSVQWIFLEGFVTNRCCVIFLVRMYQSPFCLMPSNLAYFINHQQKQRMTSRGLFNLSLLKLISFTRVIRRGKLTFRSDRNLIFINRNVASVLF